MTKDELIAFEEEIKDLFLEKKIRCPIHLSGGNEDELIEIFRDVGPDDWVLSTHRSHYHALLKGISPEWLKEEILAGRSMQIMSPEHRFFTSSIVAGILPIAVGIAMSIKMKKEDRMVYCFIGDMAAETGAFHEASKYSKNFDLPVTFIIEDNGLSTDTPTREVWGIKRGKAPEGMIRGVEPWEQGMVLYYRYERQYPHVGAGAWVSF